MRISWSIGSEKSFGHVPPVGVEPNDFSYPFCLNIGVKYHVISHCYFHKRYFHMHTTSFLRLAYRSTPYSRFCYHVIHPVGLPNGMCTQPRLVSACASAHLSTSIFSSKISQSPHTVLAKRKSLLSDCPIRHSLPKLCCSPFLYVFSLSL